MHPSPLPTSTGSGSMTAPSRTNPYPGLPWIAPALILLLALSVYPLIYSVKVSLTGTDGAVTGSHYARLFQDRFFLIAAGQTLLYTAVALLVELCLGLGLALLVDSLAHARGFFRAGLLAPM